MVSGSSDSDAVQEQRIQLSRTRLWIRLFSIVGLALLLSVSWPYRVRDASADLPSSTYVIGTNGTWQVDGGTYAALVSSVPSVWYAASQLSPAQWIWSQPSTAGDSEFHKFSKSFILPGQVSAARLDLAVDNYAYVWINGSPLSFSGTPDGAASGFSALTSVDVESLIHSGSNTITIEAHNAPNGCTTGWCNPAGLLARLTITVTPSPGSSTFLDDFSSYPSGQPPAGWDQFGTTLITPYVDRVGGTGNAFLMFPNLDSGSTDKWLVYNGASWGDEYTATVKLNITQLSPADGAGLVIAWGNENNYISILPNIYWQFLGFNEFVDGAWRTRIETPRGSVSFGPLTNYWLRVTTFVDQSGSKTATVYWSTDDTNFREILTVSGLVNLAGRIGVGTAGFNLPNTIFDDFSVTGAYQSSATTSFDPGKYGFDFANAGFVPDWALYQAVFGADQVRYADQIAAHGTLEARYYIDEFVPGFSADCDGMSALSLLYYAGGSNAHVLPPPGLSVWDALHLKLDWNYTPVSRDIAKYQGYQTGLQIREYRSQVIAQYQSYQTGSQIHPYAGANATYEAIRSEMLAGNHEPGGTLGIIHFYTDANGKEKSEGHSLVPYKIVTYPDQTAKMYVYDPNCPKLDQYGDSSSDMCTFTPDDRYVEFDLADNRWSFEFAPGKTWGQDPRDEIFETPLKWYQQRPILPDASNSNIILVAGNGGIDLLMANSQGQRVGNVDGQLITEIPGAWVGGPLTQSAADAGHEEYTLPLDSYDVQLSGVGTGQGSFALFGPGWGVSMDPANIAPTSTDTIKVAKDGSRVEYSTSMASKTYQLSLYREESDTEETYEINNAGITSGERAVYEVLPDKSLKVTNNGPAGTLYSLTLQKAGSGAGSFTRQSIYIGPNETEIISPSDWSHLSTSPITISVDTNGDGIIDETGVLAPSDTVPPTTVATVAPAPNGALWNNTDTTASLSASDEIGGSGVHSITYSASGAQTIASTTVPSASASIKITAEGETTLTYFATDNAGNAEAPKSLLVKIDKTPPTIAITTPGAGATYLVNQQLQASYTVTDALSGVASQTASSLDLSTPGTKTFTVTATDKAGNSATKTVTYTVSYGIKALYDQIKAVTSPATVPIKLQLVDASGANLSASGIVVTALGLAPSGGLESSGNANPGNNFRYDPTLGGSGGYIYNLSTEGLAPGAYTLSFKAGNDPVTHTVAFQVKAAEAPTTGTSAGAATAVSPTATASPTAMATDSPTATGTATPTVAPASASAPTKTTTPTQTLVPSYTPTGAPTATSTPTGTPVPTSVPTSTPSPSATPTSAASKTPTATGAPAPAGG